jgi:hypothetical protein
MRAGASVVLQTFYPQLALAALGVVCGHWAVAQRSIAPGERKT